MTPTEIDALLVEPMARAIYLVDPHLNIGEPVPWDDLRGPLRAKILDCARSALAAQCATLAANGLFIGPEVATEEMLNTSGYQDADEVWADMVTEWKRGGGT